MNSYLMKWICDNGHQCWAYEFTCKCGEPRTSGVKWFLPDPMVMATDAQEKLKGKGPNWFCGSCDCENPVYENENCMKCGSPIGKAKTTPSKIRYPSWGAIPRTPESAVSFAVHEVDHGDADWGMGPDTNEDQVRKLVKRSPKRNLQPSQLTSATSLSTSDSLSNVSGFLEQEVGSTGVKFSAVAIGLLIITVVSLIGYAIWFNYLDTVTKSAWVSSLAWKQSASVEQNQELSKTDWDESVPSDAYNKSCSREIRDPNHRVSDGYKEVEYQTTCDRVVSVTCAPEGDGAGGVTVPTGCTDTVTEPCTKTRSEEQYHYEILYDQSCNYNIMRWQEIANFPSSGVISSLPASGNSHETYFDHGGYTDIPNQIRITDQLGTYTVNFSSEYVDPFSFNYDYGTWLRFDLRDPVQIEVNRQKRVLFKPEPYIPQ